MYLVQQITTDAYQKQTIVLPDGSSVSLTLRYNPLQYGWTIVNLTYNTFIINGIRICNSPNLLHQFKNQIPFGLACISTTGREPTQIQDFSSGAVNMYILSTTEVESYAEYLNAEV